MQISPLSLFLDSKNYRLYTLTSSPQDVLAQEKIRESMANNPKVDLQGMIDDIIRTGWRSIGERPVVCQENGRWVVLEGNRRTCACQMILDPQIVTGHIRIPNPVSPQVLASLQTIEVDEVPNRAAADPIISGKHINATIRWTTISQMRFCVDKFDAGVPIPDIQRDGAITRPKLNKALREYRLLHKAVNKQGAWSADEKAKFESLDLAPDKYLRLFRTSGAMLDLGIQYDTSFTLSSNRYDDDTLTSILAFIARKTLIEGVIDTRFDWLDLFYPRIQGHPDLIPEVQQLWQLIGYNPPAPAPDPNQTHTTPGNGAVPGVAASNQTSTVTPTSTPSTTPPVGPGTAAGQGGSSPTGGGTTPTPPASQGAPAQAPNTGGQRPQTTPPAVFMENLICNLNGASAQGVLVISNEIVRMSQRNLYVQLPTAAAVLIRALLEQTFKYHLMNTTFYSGSGSFWDRLVQNSPQRFDPMLSKIIEFIDGVLRSGHQDDIFPPRAYMNSPRTVFGQLFDNGGALKNYSDMVIHHPYQVAASPNVLTDLSRGGLVSFLNYIYSLH